MATRTQVTIDCADPAALAAFWASALGCVVQPPPEGFDSWPAALTAWGVPQVLPTVERLAGLGAREVRQVEEMGSSWVVMTDPEGNEFCVT